MLIEMSPTTASDRCGTAFEVLSVNSCNSRAMTTCMVAGCLGPMHVQSYGFDIQFGWTALSMLTHLLSLLL